jgi:hypothetical protein
MYAQEMEAMLRRNGIPKDVFDVCDNGVALFSAHFVYRQK